MRRQRSSARTLKPFEGFGRRSVANVLRRLAFSGLALLGAAYSLRRLAEWGLVNTTPETEWDSYPECNHYYERVGDGEPLYTCTRCGQSTADPTGFRIAPSTSQYAGDFVWTTHGFVPTPKPPPDRSWVTTETIRETPW